MKNKFFTALGIFVLLLPSFFILLFLILDPFASHYTDVSKNSGVLKISDDESYFFGEGHKENSSLYELFFNLEERSERSALSVSDISSEKSFDVELNKSGKLSKIKFVPSLDGLCLWYGEDNTVYELSHADSTWFINSEYSAALYPHSSAPSLLTSASETVYPKSASWHYTLKNGIYAEGSTDRTVNETVTYYCSNYVNFEFEIKPDICNVKVFADSVKIYEGSFEDLKSSDVGERTSLRYEIVAIWSKTPEAEYFGTASYDFYVEQTKPAEFYVDETDIEAGEFVLIKVSNVSNEKGIRFSSSKPINVTPVFFRSGNIAYALVPFSSDLDAGTYTLTLKYGDSLESFNINVSKKDIIERNDDSGSGSLITSSSLSETYKLIKKIGSVYDSTIYASGTFVNYEKINNTFSIRLGFGNIKNYGDGKSIKLNGVDFWASPKGESIPAVNNGIVCAVGEDTLLGKYVVIDHGYGLKSWYCNLGEQSVSVGDTVIKGKTTVAKTGNTGLFSSSGFYLITTILDVPVSPYKLYENGFTIK